MPAPRRPTATTSSCTGPLPQHCIHTTIPSTSLSGWLPPDCRPWPGIVQSLFARVGPESGLLSLFLRLAKRSHPCCPCPFTTRASQVRARHTRYYSSPASLPLPFTGHDLHHHRGVAGPAPLPCNCFCNCRFHQSSPFIHDRLTPPVPSAPNTPTSPVLQTSLLLPPPWLPDDTGPTRLNSPS